MPTVIIPIAKELAHEAMATAESLCECPPTSNSALRAELETLIHAADYPAHRNLTEVFRATVCDQSRPLLICHRRLSRAALLASLATAANSGMLAALLAGSSSEDELAGMTSLLSRLSNAPVGLAATPSAAEFEAALTAVAGKVELVLCDWQPDAVELAHARDRGLRLIGPLSSTEKDAFLNEPASPELQAIRAAYRRERHAEGMRRLVTFQPVCALRINDGRTTEFNALTVPESDLLALDSELLDGADLPAPFTGWRYSWYPVTRGIRFSVFAGTRQYLVCGIAVDPAAGEALWARLLRSCQIFQNGLSAAELAEDRYRGVNFEDVTQQTYALKHGCPDLIQPGGQLTCPRVPYLATLVAPPGHRHLDSDELKQAFRLRDAVAALALMKLSASSA